jgi:hypothetical protein
LSSKLVDHGAPADKLAKIVRHELAHACTPKQRHNHVWQAFALAIGKTKVEKETSGTALPWQ